MAGPSHPRTSVAIGAERRRSRSDGTKLESACSSITVFASPGAPEGDALVAAGLPEGPPNTHPGQGTANRRFPFEGGYLELLFARDSQDLATDAARRLGLAGRFPGGAPERCPFGVVVRVEGAVPFPTWPYRPSYLPPEVSMPVGADSDVSSRLFVAASPFPPRAMTATHRLERVVLRGPAALAGSAAALEVPGFVRESAPAWSLELVLSGPGAGDVTLPGLPVRVRW